MVKNKFFRLLILLVLMLSTQTVFYSSNIGIVSLNNNNDEDMSYRHYTTFVDNAGNKLYFDISMYGRGKYEITVKNYKYNIEQELKGSFTYK